MITFAKRGNTRTDYHESRLARLTDVAYQVALRHGFEGSFLDLQLDLWQALRLELERPAELAGELTTPLSDGALYFTTVPAAAPAPTSVW